MLTYFELCWLMMAYVDLFKIVLTYFDVLLFMCVLRMFTYVYSVLFILTYSELCLISLTGF